MEEYILQYIDQQKKTLSSIPVEKVSTLINIFKKALADDKQIFVIGNGGSASSASHFVTDLGKGSSDKTYRRFRCHSLNDNNSWITAVGNDYSYEDIFVRQLMNLARPGDLIFIMSVSGNSPNLVKAVEWCNKNGITSISLVGGKKGKLAEISNEVIVIDELHYGRVEEAHLSICHMIAFSFMELPLLQKP